VGAVVGVFFVAVAMLQLGEVRRSREQAHVGDGTDPATYGFDLSTLAVSRRWLAAGMPRDTLTPLDRPPLLDAVQVDSLNHSERGKYLVPDDLVIGVVVGSAARAYPVRVLDWHEVANDTLGGVPVAVCRHPLSGSAVVLDRRLGDGVVSLSVSGLVWNSHHLLHDGAGSLWLPLLGEAVAGPAVGDTLAVVPSALVRWAEWRAAFPATTVPWPDPDMRAAYKRDPYGSYASSDLLRFPVASFAVPEGGRLKDQLAWGLSRRSGMEFARGHGYRFVKAAVGE
jgi:hypothetical protein